jgi:flagellar biosynthesis/type III secretory pathway protein FliH
VGDRQIKPEQLVTGSDIVVKSEVESKEQVAMMVDPQLVQKPAPPVALPPWQHQYPRVLPQDMPAPEVPQGQEQQQDQHQQHQPAAVVVKQENQEALIPNGYRTGYSTGYLNGYSDGYSMGYSNVKKEEEDGTLRNLSGRSDSGGTEKSRIIGCC